MGIERNFYIVDGEQVPLKRVNSARLVTAAKNHTLIHVASRLARSSRLAIDTNVPRNLLVVRGDASKLGEVCHYSDVQNTRSVFTDPDGHELILTDEVLVNFAKNIDDKARRELCKKLNCIVVNDTNDIWRIRVLDKEDDAPLIVANNLSAEKGIEYAEPNALQAAVYMSIAPPSDPLFVNQWHLHNTGQNGGKAGADVRALEAWEITFGSPNVRVVVHDSGVDIDHPDLMANIDPGKDFDNNDADASNDFGPHGNACAGIIAAVRNDIGVVGIAPGCRIVPLRAAGALTWNVWAETFDWAAERGDIISCSWGLSRNSTLSAAIRRAARNGRGGKGIPIFFATGNGGSLNFIEYPASLPETIAVGASTNKDIRAGYSQGGPGIDFVAPSGPNINPDGTPIVSEGTLFIETTDIQGQLGYNRNIDGDYCKADGPSGFNGTSSATPLAAGVAALILSVNNDLTAEQVREIMRETCVKIDSANANYDANGWSPKYGYGRINAADTVNKASSMAT